MSFDKVKGKLGFGCMRLKMSENEIDYGEFKDMIDAFMAAGFNYFDTAHGYIDGKSEIALRDCLVSRYNREDYIIADKLSQWYFEKEEEILPLFNKQLKQCGVDYFDFYIFHCLTGDSYAKHLRCNSFQIVQSLKKQGKIKHIAISFHDSPEVLDTILSEQQCIEAVQLQFNYLDFDDPGVRSKACYDIAIKHGKKIIIMEPVKGGSLGNLPNEASRVFDELGGGSYASYALRFAASFPNIFMVLSGMGSMDMMVDNINTFKNFTPLSSEEFNACENAREIIRKVRQIPCTACNYCAEVCQNNIPISELFTAYNEFLAAKITSKQAKELFPKDRATANDCIKCGKCEKICPQGINIKDYIEKISKL